MAPAESAALVQWDEPEDDLPTVPLRNVFLHVTKACNLHCSYCYFSARRALPDEMTREEFETLWPDLVAVRPRKVIFTGGEPLTRPDLLDLLRGLRAADPQHAVMRCLNSNGHLVTPEFARSIVGLVDEVRISIDALASRNDALRGAGNFDAAVKALDTYYAAGFEPKALVTVTAESLPDLEELLVFLIQRRITRINLNHFRPIGRGKGHDEWMASRLESSKAVARAWTRCFPGRPAPSADSISSDNACSNCGVGRFLNIMPNGDVFPCHVLTDSQFRCGNLREQSLVDICRRRGLLGELAGLDFDRLRTEDTQIAASLDASLCLGYAYAKNRTSDAWRKALPMLGR